MISVEHVQLAFNGVPVLKDVSFFVPKGSHYIIVGKNGCGKTVLLKTIAGLYKHFTGTIAIDSMPLNRYEALPVGEKRLRSITMAYVFQKGGLFDSMTVYENAAFGLYRQKEDVKVIREKVMEALEWVGLLGSEHKMPSQLSGGMQKRAGLARALCLSPSIIVYDDPTAGLDPVLADSICDLIADTHIKYNMTSLLATHDLDAARKIADNIGLLHNGRMVVDLEANEFFAKTDPYAKQFIDGDEAGPIDSI